MAHTPGPYEVTVGPTENEWVVCCEGGGDVIAEVSAHHEAPPGTAYANAILFAAAPETATERDRLKAINAELLAALEACSTWFAEAPIAELEAVEQAIEKNAPVALIHAAIAKAGED